MKGSVNTVRGGYEIERDMVQVEVEEAQHREVIAREQMKLCQLEQRRQKLKLEALKFQRDQMRAQVAAQNSGREPTVGEVVESAGMRVEKGGGE